MQPIQPRLSGEDFDAAALRLLEVQTRHVPAYRRFVEAHGKRDLKRWQDYPALPVSVFRREAVCAEGDAAKAAFIFETSGTTSSEAGRHYMKTGVYYEKSLVEGYRFFMPPLSGHCWLSLIPPYSAKPHSSLSFMIDRMATAEKPLSVDYFCDANYDIDFDRFLPLIERRNDKPIALFGTSFAWAAFLMEAIKRGGKFPLAEGSLIFDTGGFKKSSTHLTQQDLWKKLGDTLDIPLGKIWNEYGMTELSSQCYATAEEGIHRAPPWMQVHIVNPETGKRCAPGERGLIHFYDLANVESVMAIATLDTGYYEKDGFRLTGRLHGADARGCSLPYKL